MGLKYEQLDARLFAWLRKHPQGATTAQAVHSLNVSDSTSKRHISRRFSQLEDRGTLQCELQGTTRVCAVIGELPETLSKRAACNDSGEPVNQKIPATNADEFLAGGGSIHRLPAAWDDVAKNARKGSLPLGENTYGMPQFQSDSLD